MNGESWRRIATEEAFATRELAGAMRRLVDAGGSSVDLMFWRGLLFREDDDRLANLLDLDERRLATMDANGVDMHVLSLTSPGVQMLDPAEAAEIAADANDQLAAAIARHPGRYAGLAAFAPQDPEEAVREMERSVTRLGLNGFIVNSHTDGEYLDQPKYWPILEAAEALGAPIYIHPRSLPDEAVGPYRDHSLWTAMWGFAAETGLHGMRLIVSGVLDRFPKLKIVLGHLGEGIPYWVYRIDHMYPKMARRHPVRIELAPSEYLKRNFVITTSGMNHHPALEYCLQVLGPDNIMWAIDYPYQAMDEAVAFMDGAPISDADRRKIYSLNALREFRITG
ncbi:amidohydrolase family protein [Sphingosinicella sp. CPCC 101087]|uniref:amidohydrolase family protein n=1 Tax=Sphingosinicella sp. CPCC 101087 TaxID=2497754 RepID=UPI00101BAA97|nr:amidohydrolase family protein [Sphingosinicella sp. CPCC 101087]